MSRSRIVLILAVLALIQIVAGHSERFHIHPLNDGKPARWRLGGAEENHFIERKSDYHKWNQR